MENHEKKQPAGGEGTAPKQHHHKKHRNHRRGPRPEGEKPVREGGAPNQAPENRPTGGEGRPQKNDNTSGEKKKQNNQGNHNNHKGNKGNGDRQGRQNDRRGSDQKKRRPAPNRGPENLYGNPTEDDVLTMEELRARIVLKAADGSVPAEETKVTEPAAELPTEEPTPSADLLSADPLSADPLSDAPAETSEQVERVEVVGIRFRSAGKVYYFDPKKIRLRKGDFAIVETARGPEFGEVSFGNRRINKTSTVSPLRPVLRAATEADVAHNQENMEKEKQAMPICQKKIEEHKLDMKLIDVQYAFDNSKLLFYFSSEGRVDFRDLVKDLASVFRTRIELRQIGIRDEAKMLGGLGACGRPLCCASFLSDFVQVSIKMAKEQGLSLNSAKISGLCGRLMCCLRYESEVYAEELRRLPPHDALVKTPDGIGSVISCSPLSGMVKVYLKNAPDAPQKQYHKDEITVLPREKNEGRPKNERGHGDAGNGKNAPAQKSEMTAAEEKNDAAEEIPTQNQE